MVREIQGIIVIFRVNLGGKYQLCYWLIHFLTLFLYTYCILEVHSPCKVSNCAIAYKQNSYAGILVII